MNESMNDQTLLYPLLFEPNLHTVVWGGGQLRPYKGLDAFRRTDWGELGGECRAHQYEHHQQWQVAGKGSGVGDPRTARGHPGQEGE